MDNDDRDTENTSSDALPRQEIRDAMKRFDMLFTQIDSTYVRIAKAHGLTYNTLMILYMADDSDTVTQAQVCDELYLPKSTVHSMVRDLMKKGLVTLTDGRNRKEKHITLTEQGRTLMEPINAETWRIEAAAVEAIPTGDIGRVVELMQNAADNMAQAADDIYGDTEARKND